MNGIHDMGGMDGFGPVRPEANEPVFHVPWEGRVFAMLLNTAGIRRPVAASMRKQIERIPPADYLRISYYEKWLETLIATLIEAGAITEAEAWPERLLPTPVHLPLRPADDSGPLRVAAFVPGDRVRARDHHPTWHTRMPRYVRGHVGAIASCRGNAVFDDSRARGAGDAVQPLYTVRFTAHELWGERGHPADSVHVELWEDHLEPA